MTYQSLYRRYRPRRFGEVRGQDQVVVPLRNAVREDRVGHAYLFSGPRGTGKTTTARILAKALNCTNLQDGEPCCECESCSSIEAGTSYDLHELDAASNNKVENARDLIERVSLGSPGRTKVYILDEVHMLTPAASNALLKTLEEPPPHVVFVLATTDPLKVIPTIRSRTQHFDFHLLPAEVLADHVRFVITDAGLNVDPDDVGQIVRQGAGSARDALSALDQAAAGGVHERGEQVEVLVDALCANDTGQALKAVAEAVTAGRDPRVLGEALLARLRDVFLVRMGAELDQVTAADRERAEGWAEQLTDRATTRALEEVGAALLEMRQAPDPRIPLEVALVRLTHAEVGTDVGALVARIERLETALADRAAAPDGGGDGAPPPPPPVPPSPRAEPERASAASRPADAARAALGRAAPRPPDTRAPKASAPPPDRSARSYGPDAAVTTPAVAATSTATATVEPLDRDVLTLAWADVVLPQLKQLTKAMFGLGRFVSVDGSAATLALPNQAHRQRCEQKRAEVEAALSAEFGRPITLRLVVDTEAGGDDTVRDATAIGTAGRADDDEVIDLRDLVDAPADTRTGMDRLAEAFPGSEIIEEDT